MLTSVTSLVSSIDCPNSPWMRSESPVKINKCSMAYISNAFILLIEFASYVERTAWLQILFGILTQVSAEVAFPSYNVVLGFWGVYAAINKHGRATFGYE